LKNKFAVVVTTIGEGAFLQRYIEQIEEEHVSGDATIIVIPDRKTPSTLFANCRSAGQRSVRVLCPTLEEQEDFLGRLGKIKDIIPYDSDNRRNVGYLMALEEGCDFIISIDDDNHCVSGQPYFGEHAVVVREDMEGEAVHCSNGWYNICELMETDPPGIYPRGFPYHARHVRQEQDLKVERGPVHINEGLWLQDPDVDAITWLACRPQAKGFHHRSLLLGGDTWTAINTQNTALARQAVAAFYFLRMGYPVAGLRIDRYGDIFAGYFCQACARHLAYGVRVGTPVARHARNAHDYLRDLREELGCILLVEELSEWLRELSLQGSTYQEAYLCLADMIDEAVEDFSGVIWDQQARDYFHLITGHMRTWIRAVDTIGL